MNECDVKFSSSFVRYLFYVCYIFYAGCIFYACYTFYACCQVAAVLDWELSTLGDGMSDLAYICIAYHLDPANPFFRGLKGIDLPAKGIPDMEEMVRLYGASLARHSEGSLPSPSLHDLDYYLAFSFFRSCSILQVRSIVAIYGPFTDLHPLTLHSFTLHPLTLHSLIHWLALIQFLVNTFSIRFAFQIRSI